MPQLINHSLTKNKIGCGGLRKTLGVLLGLSVLYSLCFSSYINNEGYASIETTPQSQNTVDNLPTYKYNFVEIRGEYRIHFLDNETPLESWIVHIPQVGQDQTPISIRDVYTTPINIITGWQITHEPFSGNNTVLEAFFTDVESGEYRLHWTVHVMVRENERTDFPSTLPLYQPNDIPTETHTWLESSQYIQANHSEIVNKSIELAAGSTDAIQITRNILNYTTNLEYGVNITDYSQDALSTLQREEAVCTGKANLCTALLRALGIPARVHLIYPTHFVTECYLHPYGWIRVEPGMNAFCHEVFTPSTTSTNFLTYITAFVPEPSEETESAIYNGFGPISGVIAYYTPINGSNTIEIYGDDDWLTTGKWGTFDSAKIISPLATNLSTDILDLSKLYWELRTAKIDQLGSIPFTEAFPNVLQSEAGAFIYMLQNDDLARYMEQLTVAALKLLHDDDSYQWDGLDEGEDSSSTTPEEEEPQNISSTIHISMLVAGMSVIFLVLQKKNRMKV